MSNLPLGLRASERGSSRGKASSLISHTAFSVTSSLSSLPEPEGSILTGPHLALLQFRRLQTGIKGYEIFHDCETVHHNRTRSLCVDFCLDILMNLVETVRKGLRYCFC